MVHVSIACRCQTDDRVQMDDLAEWKPGAFCSAWLLSIEALSLKFAGGNFEPDIRPRVVLNRCFRTLHPGSQMKIRNRAEPCVFCGSKVSANASARLSSCKSPRAASLELLANGECAVVAREATCSLPSGLGRSQSVFSRDPGSVAHRSR